MDVLVFSDKQYIYSIMYILFPILITQIRLKHCHYTDMHA